MYKYKFIVSRKFQVNRYLGYIKFYGIEKHDVEFFDVTNWTGGDCGIDFPYKFNRKVLERPKILRNISFGNYFHYLVCLVLIFNSIITALFSRKVESNVIFIDQYFSPFEVFALTKCLSKNNLVIVHQHALNCQNQLDRNFFKDMFELITHKLIKNIFYIVMFKIRYVAFATSISGKDSFSKSLKGINAYLVGDINLTKIVESNVTNKTRTIIDCVGIISPGMYRYNSKTLALAQSDFFKTAEEAAKCLFEDINLIYRLKAGEPLNLFTKVKKSDMDQDFYDFLESTDVIITSSVSSTWLEGLLFGKGVVIVQNETLEKEYPIMSDLFLDVLDNFSYRTTIKSLGNNSFYIPKDNIKELRIFLLEKITPFCDPFKLIGKLQWQKL